MLTRRAFTAAMAASPLLAQRPRRPNIVFIIADDLGYGDLGCYGQSVIPTPNIDRLAKEGMRFTQAYAGATVCAPSRCSLMTGFHGGHARVRGNKNPEVPLQAGDVVIPEVLHKAGYHTGIFGKWGLGYTGTDSVPNKKGFDEFFGYHTQLQAHTYYPHNLYDNGRDFTIPNNWGTKQREYAPDLIAARAVKFLDAQRAANPFFLYLPSTLPHANNELGRDTGDGMEIPGWGEFATRDWPNAEKGFAGMVTYLDRFVGRVLDKLHETGADQNTVVIFTSDNGPHQEGGHQSTFFKSSGPLRGIKRDLYEGGIRVPFLVRWPGTVAPGTTSDQPIAFWDMLPTLAEIGGGSAPAKLDGVSVARAFRGESLPPGRVFYWEFHEGGFNRAVRFGDWKAIQFGPSGPIELYNLKADLGEKTDVAAANPALVADARRHFAAARSDNPEFPVQSKAANSPDRKK